MNTTETEVMIVEAMTEDMVEEAAMTTMINIRSGATERMRMTLPTMLKTEITMYDML